jgi:hypothetical protein
MSWLFASCLRSWLKSLPSYAVCTHLLYQLMYPGSPSISDVGLLRFVCSQNKFWGAECSLVCILFVMHSGNIFMMYVMLLH